MAVTNTASIELLPVAKPARNPCGREYFILIDSRRLERQCFIRSIELLKPEIDMDGYSSGEELLSPGQSEPSSGSVLFNMGSRNISDPETAAQIGLLATVGHLNPVVVLGISDDLAEMMAVFEAGATGYIPGNIGIEAVIDAVRLAATGGVFLKMESLERLGVTSGDADQTGAGNDLLTVRQSAVAQALLRGKANKTIAYELNMCESTVKVHIRTIMRKLNATNRTEAAFKLRAILPAQPEPA